MSFSDVIAYNPSKNQRLGITVKSRTRDIGKEEEPVNIFSYQKGKNDRQKLFDAYKAFACEPWIAVYVEILEFADVYLISVENYDEKYRGKEGRAIDDWKMRKKDKERYNKDHDVKHIRIEFHTTNWSW